MNDRMSRGEYYVLIPTHEYEYYIATTIHEVSTTYYVSFTIHIMNKYSSIGIVYYYNIYIYIYLYIYNSNSSSSNLCVLCGPPNDFRVNSFLVT